MLRQGQHLQYNSAKDSPLVAHDDPFAQMIEYMIPSYLFVLLTVRNMHYGFQEVLCQCVDSTLIQPGKTNFFRWYEVHVDGPINDLQSKIMKQLRIIKTQCHGGSLYKLRTKILKHFQFFVHSAYLNLVHIYFCVANTENLVHVINVYFVVNKLSISLRSISA